MRALLNTIIATIGTATTAFAAKGGNADNPGILCWAFFGICAIIFACQMVPAAMMWIGAAKALTMKPAEMNNKA